MRPYALLYLYRRRLRVHAVQEVLAGVGIAVAVALVFATLVAEGSISGSASEVVHTVVGPANLQIRARGQDGFPAGLLGRVQRTEGVKQAAGLLEQSATVRAPDGRSTPVVLAGAETSLAVMDGLARTLPLAALAPGGIGLSSTSAKALGIDRPGLGEEAPGNGAGAAPTIVLDVRGRAHALKLGAVLGSETAGALSKALVAVMSLEHLQRLTGLEGRVSRILVQSKPGQEAAVRVRLQALAGGGLEVASADQDVVLLREALRPSDLASGLFAAIGALLGLLLAFNAMLLTVPERRRAIADLRLEGTRKGAVAQMVLFQALCLGVVASLVGLAAGLGLSVWVFHQSSDYLAEAFTLAGGTIVSARPLLLAGLGGVAATCLASALPLLDLRKGKARDSVYLREGVPGNALEERARRRLFVASVSLVALAGALYWLVPAAAVGAVAALALATVLAVPLIFAGVLRIAGALAERRQSWTTLPVALASLRATTVRSLALAATGAVALFGSVALGGSREDLLRGIKAFAHSYVSDADIWVGNPGDNQSTQQFADTGQGAQIAKLAGVASVREFQGGFVQMGSRRVWVVARPPGGAREVLGRELQDGDPTEAGARLGGSGWVVLSQKLAEERGVGIGEKVTLPTPGGPRSFKLAATTTNLAWPPGVVFMSTADFTRYWRSAAPTALAVSLRAGADPLATRAEIAQALGKDSGLEVSLASTREAKIDALTSEGLGQLKEIATLLVLAAVGAMGAALASSIWQRRAWLAGLRFSGAKPTRLRRVLGIEAALMLGAGCVAGAVAGIFGQIVIDAYLKRVTGFPLAHAVAGARPLELLALVLAASLALVSVPGWAASRVPPLLALQDE